MVFNDVYECLLVSACGVIRCVCVCGACESVWQLWMFVSVYSVCLRVLAVLRRLYVRVVFMSVCDMYGVCECLFVSERLQCSGVCGWVVTGCVAGVACGVGVGVKYLG